MRTGSRPRLCWNCWGNLSQSNAQGEYYLTDTVGLALERGWKASAYRSENPDVILGANTRKDLLHLNKVAQERVLEKHMENGVNFVNTDGIIIGNDVEIGAETTILPGTILRGKTKIGAKCTIGPNCLIENCNIGDHVTLNYVQAFESEIEDAVKAGPFVHIRPNSHLKNGVKIGDFVEVKNSTVGEQTAIAHLTYVGDSDVGKKVNFGCGTVTVNYDGLKKQRCVIGDNCFIGCNTNLIAPVELGKGAYTAAGSTVTKGRAGLRTGCGNVQTSRSRRANSLKKLKKQSCSPRNGGKESKFSIKNPP